MTVVNNLFWRLLNGCTLFQLARVFNSEWLRDHIYLFDLESASAWHPACGSLPWTVELFLGAHSRKHIFSAKKRLGLDSYVRSVVKFKNKMQWRMYLMTESPNEAGYKRYKASKETPEFNQGDSPQEITCFGNSMSRALCDALKSDYVRAKGYKPMCSFIDAFKHAESWIASSGMHCVPSDKDGGVVLVEKIELLSLLREKLVLPKYDRVIMQAFQPIVFRRAMYNYFDDIAEAINTPELATHFKRQCSSNDPSKVCASLLCTIKTHKPDGSVKARVIHSGAGNPFAPFLRFLASFYRSTLSGFSHVYGSSDEVLKDILSIRFPSEIAFYKIDIEDFYMQGSPDFHASCSFNDVENLGLRKALKGCVRFVLDEQFVVNKIDGSLYKIYEGSGQGQVLSGDLADNSFLHTCESEFAALKDVQLKHKVYGYFRYRDDILIVALRGEGIHAFFQEMKRLCSGVYKLSVEEVGLSSISFLDFTLYKSRSFDLNGTLSHKLYVKPTHQAISLSCSSMHHPSTHIAWLKGEVDRGAVT